MSSPIRFSSPFIKKFIHNNFALGTTSATSPTTILDYALSHERRAVVIIQNQDSGNPVYVRLQTEDPACGLMIPPLGSISLDNYNGIIRVYGTAGSIVHLAYATA